MTGAYRKSVQRGLVAGHQQVIFRHYSKPLCDSQANRNTGFVSARVGIRGLAKTVRLLRRAIFATASFLLQQTLEEETQVDLHVAEGSGVAWAGKPAIGRFCKKFPVRGGYIWRDFLPAQTERAFFGLPYPEYKHYAPSLSLGRGVIRSNNLPGQTARWQISSDKREKGRQGNGQIT